MAHNRYYIINASDPNISQIEGIIVGTIEQQRPSVDETQMVVKLFEGDHEQHPQLSQYIEYSHTEILPIMNGPDWVKTITNIINFNN